MASQMFMLRMQVLDYVTLKAPSGLRVLACRSNDATCTSPVNTFDDPDGTGAIELALPGGFIGFLEVTGDGMLPGLWYLTRPIDGDRTFKDLLVVSPDTLRGLASITGYSADAGKGLVIMEAFDCDEGALGGVHFDEEKGGALPFYIVDLSPNVDVKVSVLEEENNATGGLLNAEVGFNQFSAMLGIDGALLGKFNARVAASTVTYIDIYRP